MNSATIPVLTIKQPWAHLIMHAGKDIENRDWPTKMRGRIAIHASAKLSMDEYQDAMDLIYSEGLANFDLKPTDIACGCILGTVEIVNCVTGYLSPWFTGKYGFVLRNPRPLAKPIPAKGSLGFWRFPAAQLEPSPSPGGGQ